MFDSNLVKTISNKKPDGVRDFRNECYGKQGTGPYNLQSARVHLI
jgi:hypothetical protein